MQDSHFDLIVIGGGPGGYVSAIRASQLGLKVALIDKNEALGGTCLRVGCIPSKALLEASERYHDALHNLKNYGIVSKQVSLDLKAMMQRKETTVKSLTQGISGLMKKNNITRFSGIGRFLSNTEIKIESPDKKDMQKIQGSKILLATGSKVATIPGVELDYDLIGTSTEALAYSKVPEHLIVIGAGVIGLELGSVWNRLGSKVTVIEYLDRILPGMDAQLAHDAKKVFNRQGMDFKLKHRVLKVNKRNKECVVQCENQPEIIAERVLLAVGRVPNTESLNLENVDIALDSKGRIPVNSHFQTSQKNIFAIGDVIKGPMLAHKAEEEGVACVENIVTGYGHVNYQTIPSVVYTEPEIASVGKSEEDLKNDQTDYRIGKFPFMANGRARALGSTEGWVKILANAKTDKVVGVHIIGPRAGDLIAEVAVAMNYGASSEDIARSCHAHPTLAEVVKEAALNVDERSIHI